MDAINTYLKEQLQQRADRNALRMLPVGPSGLDFCSNDYLGFARIQFSALETTLFGATGSRLLSGNHAGYTKLETQLSVFHHSEAALVFGSGYQANLGLLSAIATRHDTILYDELSHASIRDAVRLSPARSFSFQHNDVEHLQQKLRQASGKKWVVAESIYSMDGDAAPLLALQDCCDEFDAALIVDEAHAVGVFGPQGRGLVVEMGLADRVWARVVTFGKALGCHGAAVLGSALLREFLVNFSRPFIYTTGLPPESIYRIGQCYALLEKTDQIATLQHCIEHFTTSLNVEIKNRLIPSRSAIQCLVVPGNEAAKALAATLQQAGFDIRPILHPTVPAGSERLRICLHSFNRLEDIRRLAEVLNDSFRL